MIKRLIQKDLKTALKQFPVVSIIGPRQVGKTTLAKSLISGSFQKKRKPVYLDLELPSDVAKLQNPQLYLESFDERLVIIDEVQCMPELYPIIRALVDRNRKPGKYLLLGSANLGTLRDISESLAGRIVYVELSPFVRPEINAKASLQQHWLKGGYPDALLARSLDASTQWREALIRSYLERDLPQLGFRVPAMELRRFWTMLAHNHGQLWNAQQLASSFGVTPPTATHHRSILEQMFLVRTIPAWHSNTKKRMVKSPRVYVCDSGILHSLLGIETMDDLMSHPIAGKSWEGFVIEQVVGCLKGKAQLSFSRTHAGAEMDLIIHRGSKVLAAAKIKLGLTPRVTKGFHESRKDLKNPPTHIIYGGDDRYAIAKGVEAVGLDEYASKILPKVLR